MSTVDWESWLARWNRELLERLDLTWFGVRNHDTIDTGVSGLERLLREAPHSLETEPDLFERYLATALAISADETVGTAIYLRNPKIVTSEGAWEALYVAEEIAGAERDPSFWELMQAERDAFLSMEG